MLVGKEIFDQINKSDGQYFADNFYLIEQDVKKSFVDGVPSIDFSKRVFQLLEKEMSTSVRFEGMIGKVTKLDFNTDSIARGQYARMAVFVNLGVVAMDLFISHTDLRGEREGGRRRRLWSLDVNGAEDQARYLGWN
ncbi:hypothetical protein GOBAR_AA35361 [Gossypium barbadense]|uniref:Uncharacterized protein n=1 Tax=Gossypium barbadense TaxID=3634 RepID=A0A2P5W2N3_GOSBA|nr:hypothetical protein GOBAR_AA35361 [Gossypium barbadense]